MPKVTREYYVVLEPKGEKTVRLKQCAGDEIMLLKKQGCKIWKVTTEWQRL
jgi:hypothetical protein